MLIRSIVRALFTVFIAASLLSSPARAEDAKLSMEKLQSIVSGLGYEPVVDKRILRFTASGKRDVSLLVFLSDDDTVLYINAFVEDVKKDDITKIPTFKLLEYNDTHPDFFSLNKTDAGYAIYLISELTASTVKPQSIREIIDRLAAVLEVQADMLNQANWK